MTALRPRQRLGKYRIERRLAEGGFAQVYRAQDLIEGVPVALKIPLAQGPQALVEMQREARVLAKLDHPNILPIKSADQIGDTIVVAYALGKESLADRLTRRLSPRTALRYTHQILRAVAFAHARRVVHMDIKPENFVLFDDGRLRLTDFGTANVVRKTRLRSMLTGTVGYMAPEQALGRPSTRSDVFSVGLVMYRMLAGTVPEWPFEWPGPRHDRLQKLLRPAMLRVLRDSLEVDARNRFRDAGDQIVAFERALPRALRDGERIEPEPCAWCETGDHG